MKNFRLLNLVTGWVTFVIAAITYLMTIEPTVSFWDCGEFITTAFKLEVGHPPGAPFFMLLGRFFTIFSDAANAGKMINSLSALASAFTILFLFWTITHLAKKLVNTEELSLGQTIAILGSGLIGALAYTFSDTFWFSAVEGEVYATSSLVTALVFWAILKWESIADQPHATRWIILIAYLVGLSIGVHLLNLLAIPAIVFVYYFKKYTPTTKGVIYSLILSVVMLGLVMYGIIPGVVKVASWFELLFVNSFGLPFNSGVIFYAIVLVGLIIYGLYYTMKKKKVLWNTVLLAFTVILIGYSSYAIVVIRSSANTPMNQNTPDDVFSLLSYLNRDQYGDNPLFIGQYYNTPRDSEDPTSDGSPYYIQEDGKYVVAYVRQEVNYDSRYTTIFPRMWSSQPAAHVTGYKSWAGITGKRVSIANELGENQIIELPTFGENLTYFIRYQLVHMYFRYFMWNFVGRQNDIQGNGDNINGNWLSGIGFIDSMRLGDQTYLPENLKNNRGRNTYYFLPLLLGLIGAFFHYKKSQKDFWVVMLLFILTGIAIVVYLNQTPQQPRERDYAYAGSFYAFAIWIGLGVMSIFDFLKDKKLPATASAIAVSALSLVLVPGIMASENWDDHDRSGRYTARDFGYDYLATCDENAVIFTNGDNDTFPLWYNQEVESVRPDVRVCNLSYLQTDWYIDQMKQQAYDSEPLPISFEHDQYLYGTRDFTYILPDDRIQGAIELNRALEFVKSEDPGTKLTQYGNAAYIPAKMLYLKVDKEAVIRNKVVPESMYDQIQDTIFFDFSDREVLYKDELMLLDMIATSNWERPLYFAFTIGSSKYLNLENYFQIEGFAYRFTPVLTQPSGDGIRFGSVNTERMYDNLMNKFKWGNMNDPDVYIDENNQRMMTNIRNVFNRLADGLIEEGKMQEAVEVLDRNMELIPSDKVEYNYFSQQTTEYYYAAGATDKANDLASKIHDFYVGNLEFYLSLHPDFLPSVDEEITRNIVYLRELARVTDKYEQQELTEEIAADYNSYAEFYLNNLQ